MKKAIIVGATSGIGREVARRLLQDGWTIGAAGRRIELLESLQAEFGADKVKIAALDITTREAEDALDRLVSQLGSPDLYLHTSGIGGQNKVLDIEKEIGIIRTNCEGMPRMVDHFINYVRGNSEYSSSRPAHIAVITSVAGTRGMGTAPAYSATKSMQSAYLTALAQLVRMEKIPVIFTDIRPGFVDTDILSKSKHYPLMISREAAADHIIRGLKKKKRVLIFDWRFRLIVFFWKLIPLWLWERLVGVTN
ncbi:MAG: SDR family NAD(P)-dependent oxidoreductase [Bacteroidales bacterium]|nr:SDR family NAD(P)-dependent oxidoreductase [Bacteroidales bacterium]